MWSEIYSHSYWFISPSENNQDIIIGQNIDYSIPFCCLKYFKYYFCQKPFKILYEADFVWKSVVLFTL